MLALTLALLLAAPAAGLESVQEPAAKPKPLYDEQANASAQIAAAMAVAEKKNQRVILVWGGNW